ncbi:urea amidolyase [Arthrobacter psychrolactophilus]|uniref:Urea amidolyase n=1 Tax=Arthrobacter psychrolactophilus TaxID=92442 RepID=A0A2V5JDW6_9MICC|nr:urea amidolyase family protein [Arthrobacter psychrolactophilus]PYI37487.1 urea amidolyase [Arthrobacter psychrolactophilus]
MKQLHILPAGELAILIELDSLAHVMGAQVLLRQRALPGVIEIIAAAKTVFVQCDSPSALRHVMEFLDTATVEDRLPPSGTIHRIKTRYDGADLTDAARLTGLSVEALVAWHSGQRWAAAFGGFAPGFMYLAPADHRIMMPRRDTPRTVVPAGSVAVGGEFSAVYPGPTPGGWQLLGRCADTIWNIRRDPAALIQPGDGVEFVPVRELIEVTRPKALAASAPSDTRIGTPTGFTVLAPGVHTTVQDLGRPGFAHLGVPSSGALDRAALRRANSLVGNDSHAAALEIVLSGLRLKASGSHVMAVAGTSPELRISGLDGIERVVPGNAPFLLHDGEILTICAGAHGFRSYLAVRGNIEVPAVLGSRATDVLSALGQPPLTAGAFLPVARRHDGVVGTAEIAAPPTAEVSELHYRLGPRDNWFTPQSLAAFEAQTWDIGPQSNRIGLRLTGTPLSRTPEAEGAELPSEGLAHGSLQVPPSGLPVLFLADHPVTGGYPVLGVVHGSDLDKAAQLAPGARVRFRRTEA